MKPKLIGYWICTALIVLGQGASGIADLVQPAPLLEVFSQTGLPTWFLYILGPWKIAGVICLAAPGLKRAKEWAYAGFFFDFTGAAAVHALAGQGIADIMPPLVICAILIGSYVLRPESRKLPGPAL